MIKKIAYVDRLWGHCEDRSIGGDMGFSFNDSADTRSENIQEVLDDCRDYAMGDGAKKGDDTYQPENGTFAIYEVYKADINLESEEDYLWSGDIEDQELIEVNVCATKEVAGWIEDVDKSYKNVKINYREED